MAEQDNHETRQERRHEKLRKKRRRIPQHGLGLARAYRDAIVKRARQIRRKGNS